MGGHRWLFRHPVSIKNSWPREKAFPAADNLVVARPTVLSQARHGTPNSFYRDTFWSPSFTLLRREASAVRNRCFCLLVPRLRTCRPFATERKAFTDCHPLDQSKEAFKQSVKSNRRGKILFKFGATDDFKITFIVMFLGFSGLSVIFIDRYTISVIEKRNG